MCVAKNTYVQVLWAQTRVCGCRVHAYGFAHIVSLKSMSRMPLLQNDVAQLVLCNKHKKRMSCLQGIYCEGAAQQASELSITRFLGVGCRHVAFMNLDCFVFFDWQTLCF